MLELVKNKWVGVLLIAVFCLGLYAALKITSPNPTQSLTPLEDARQNTQHLNWYPQPRALTDFTITKHDGSDFTNENLKNKWTLAFVGYTYCPDICPITLAELNSLYPELSESVKNTPLQIWFLSVDPKRDTTERLNEYINYFNSEFVAASGPHEQLFPLVRSMGMMYSMTQSTDQPDYLVDHSASVVVIDPNGHVVGRFKPKHVPGEYPISDTAQIMTDMPLLLASE